MSRSEKKATQKHVALVSLSYPSNVIVITCKNPCQNAKNSVKPVEHTASKSKKCKVLSETLTLFLRFLFSFLHLTEKRRVKNSLFWELFLAKLKMNLGIYKMNGYQIIRCFKNPEEEKRVIALVRTRTHHVKNTNVVCRTSKI